MSLKWNKLYYFRLKLYSFFSRRESKKCKEPKYKRKYRKIITGKLGCFINSNKFYENRNRMKITKEILNKALEKLGPNPICYLTGDKIDINDAKSYNLDHIIPKAKGGDNSIENLGILTKQANMAKSEYTVEEHIEYCKKVLNHQGYDVVRRGC